MYLNELQKSLHKYLEKLYNPHDLLISQILHILAPQLLQCKFTSWKEPHKKKSTGSEISTRSLVFLVGNSFS